MTPFAIQALLCAILLYQTARTLRIGNYLSDHAVNIRLDRYDLTVGGVISWLMQVLVPVAGLYFTAISKGRAAVPLVMAAVCILLVETIYRGIKRNLSGTNLTWKEIHRMMLLSHLYANAILETQYRYRTGSRVRNFLRNYFNRKILQNHAYTICIGAARTGADMEKHLIPNWNTHYFPTEPLHTDTWDENDPDIFDEDEDDEYPDPEPETETPANE